eukprot:gnl/MRDRNA2_/MRDRNA2_117824_c0_seq1.p1 gnl/MRDRNA2_/MRDRNA2_117824_c0~~gnl/MRDRNA2_/MRDRNA2_117824_c0_seq1.p1  ORF type:complete len:392 (+),score=76.83 gnl/MRDRNA2_/MRDRNA2_117824_c0_seq1:373-1548(+)
MVVPQHFRMVDTRAMSPVVHGTESWHPKFPVHFSSPSHGQHLLPLTRLPFLLPRSGPIPHAQSDVRANLDRDLAAFDKRLEELAKLELSESDEAKRKAIQDEKGFLQVLRANKIKDAEQAEKAYLEIAPAAWLWEVQGHGSRSWLVGTMHVSDPRVTTLHPLVEDALAQAQMLYTELGDDDDQQQKVEEAGRLSLSETLADILPASTYRELHDILTYYDMDNKFIDDMEPWLLCLKVTQIDAIRMQQDGMPLDLVLRSRARALGMQLGNVETIEDQIALMKESRDDAINTLNELLAIKRKEMETGVFALDDEIKSFVDGSVEELEANAEKVEAQIAKRNQLFASQIHSDMQADPSSVRIYAFGVLHFPGKAGIIADLQSRGYQVSMRLPKT